MDDENYKKHNLLLLISNYRKGDYVQEFYKDVQKYHKGIERALITAFSSMCQNIGDEEYDNFLNNKAHITRNTELFIKYRYNNGGFKGFLERFKVRRDIKFDKNLDVSNLPNLILEDILKYKPNGKTPTMFDVLPDGLNIQSFQ